MEKNDICFFGTSVTQQKNGFVKYLTEKLNINKISFCYGGMHINDAGICYIDDVIASECKYCFIDFFSTDFICTNNLMIEYLDTIVYKFTKANIKLVFLFLPRNDHNDRINYYNFLKTYLISKNLYYIDLNEYFEYSTDIIRDAVHTTDLGSEKYAELIYEKFTQTINEIQLPLDITETKYCHIKKIEINKIFNKKLVVDGKAFIVGFLLKIGPNSGWIEINGIKYLVWDIYCHYIRENMRLTGINIDGITDINILQDDVDYSKCRREITEKNVIKYQDIINICYIGELRFISGE